MGYEPENCPLGITRENVGKAGQNSGVIKKICGSFLCRRPSGSSASFAAYEQVIGHAGQRNIGDLGAVFFEMEDVAVAM